MKPDLDAAKRFLDALFGENASICFQDFWPNREEKKKAWVTYGDFDQVAADLSRRNKKGFGTYFMVNEGDGKGRSAENVVQVRALFVDLDGSPLKPVQECGCPPHIITQTSSDRFQAFWKVTDCPLDKFKPMIIGLADRFAGDRNIADLPRVMRLPGFFNTKRTPPFLVRIIEENPGEAVSWTRLIRDLGLVLPVNGHKKENQMFYDDEKSIVQGGRHKFVANLCYRLRSQGLSPEVLKSSILATNQSRCVPPLPEKEIDMILRGTLKNVAPRDYSQARPRYEPTGRVMQPSKVITLKELHLTQFPPVSWIVRDFLPTGLCILAGHPKVGKSWLAQALTICVASGEPALGVFETNKGSCLSLSLEDTPQRFKFRMGMILNGAEPPECGFFL